MVARALVLASVAGRRTSFAWLCTVDPAMIWRSARSVFRSRDACGAGFDLVGADVAPLGRRQLFAAMERRPDRESMRARCAANTARCWETELLRGVGHGRPRVAISAAARVNEFGSDVGPTFTWGAADPHGRSSIASRSGCAALFGACALPAHVGGEAQGRQGDAGPQGATPSADAQPTAHATATVGPGRSRRSRGRPAWSPPLAATEANDRAVGLSARVCDLLWFALWRRRSGPPGDRRVT